MWWNRRTGGGRWGRDGGKGLLRLRQLADPRNDGIDELTNIDGIRFKI